MSETKKRLGRGLNSLVSATRFKQMDQPSERFLETTNQVVVNRHVATNAIQEIPLDKITRNPHQPRHLWDETDLAALAQSIQANGLIQPILVRPIGDSYQLIAGERRLRATQLSGNNTIAAIVRDATEEKSLEWALIENIHRTDLNSLERARAYQHYLKEFSLTQNEAAERLGEDRSTIANYIRLLDLPESVQQMINEKLLSMGHARALLALPDKMQRRSFAQRVIQKNLSVRELEKQIQAHKYDQQRPAETPTQKPPHIQDLEQELTRHVGTKVLIKPTGKKGHRGKIIIEYYSLDDFDRVREQLLH